MLTNDQNNPVELYVPKFEDLWFYQTMMSDPETMSYNAGWDVDYDGYHRDTGCVDYPDDSLPDWYAHWMGQEPKRFYAYIKRCSDGAWIGDVNFYYTPEKDWWDMGIVLYAPYRGQGYAVPALKLLLEHGFCDLGISRIHNYFEETRTAARAIHRKAGFRETGVKDGILHLLITKEEFLLSNNKLVELYVPKLEDLWFLQKMESDPATMSYNVGWDVDFPGYHRDTGCIDNPDESLPDLYKRLVGQEPERFYTYIQRRADGVWVGCVGFYYDPGKDWRDMDVVVYAPYRGQGYAVPALKLMLEHAFVDCGISRIHNEFELARNEVAAWQTHRKAGFQELGVKDGILHMMITKEEFLSGT